MNRLLPTLSWILYDFANTIFSMNVVTLYFSLWVTVNNGKPDIWVGVANGLSALLIVAALPMLGVWSDAYHRKRAYLTIATVACCALTAGMGVAALSGLGPSTRVLAALACFVVANFAYHAGIVFYNALLTSVADPARMGRVSGWGVGAGYLGAILGLLLVMPFATGKLKGTSMEMFTGPWSAVATAPDSEGDWVYRERAPDPDVNCEYRLQGGAAPAAARDVFAGAAPVTLTDGSVLTHARYFEVTFPAAPAGAVVERRTAGLGRPGTFIPTACLFLVFALPCMILVRERRESPGEAITAVQAWKRVWTSLRETRKHPGVLRFMIAKYLYEDAISTVYIFMAVYSSKVMKFTDETQRFFLLTATTFAMLGSLACGYVTDRIGPKRTLQIVLGGWVVFLSAAAFSADERHFWFIGPALGVLLGSMWTSSRPLLVSLVPAGAQGEFFALSELTGKMSAVVGPVLWGAIVLMAARAGFSELNGYRIAIGSLVALILLGAWVLRKVPDMRRLPGA
ncbi:MAG: MFS transporter [Candidatus Brocadiae bacterium]|nr:MFS transporter [Candidatus Brocadiia bacterium]